MLEGLFPGRTAAQLFAPIAEAAAPAPSSVHQVEFGHGLFEPDGRHITTLPPLSDDEGLDNLDTSRLAQLAGHIVDLDTELEIRIGSGGSACLTYRYRTLNLSDRPLTRVQRELWFEHTVGGLTIEPLRGAKRRLAIQPLHDTPNLSKFACQISPAVQPGESADISYTCDGGRFIDSLYWRQSVYRYTRRFSINLRHADAGRMVCCSALEEYPDGSERSVTEDLIWDDESNDVTVSLTREYLRPNQSITLRWDVAREHA
ncbi:hypothetical protein [Nocardia cyriacigeorgica]|uniref:hypothetical protein n=1 Tax=Nocardia cyriacigeorgica TaxID=135487 RepID=UPI002457F978|nr:hypothetical protein [Nocardia cyriacigeorgica]